MAVHRSVEPNLDLRKVIKNKVTDKFIRKKVCCCFCSPPQLACMYVNIWEVMVKSFKDTFPLRKEKKKQHVENVYYLIKRSFKKKTKKKG